MLLIEELIEVELLVVLGEELSEEVAIAEILFEVGDSFGELNLLIEPVENDFAHCVLAID